MQIIDATEDGRECDTPETAPRIVSRAEASADTSARASESSVALLRLCREIAAVFERFGAHNVADDWAASVRRVAQEAIAHSRSGAANAPDLELLVKDVMWARVFELMRHNDARAYAHFCATVLRLLGRLDRRRAYEDSWEDIVQITAMQMLDACVGGHVSHPWGMLCTIVKRRYVDLNRGCRPLETLNEELDAAASEASPGEFLTTNARRALSALEWTIISRMDLAGETRSEIADSMNLTEGQVLSARRAGLRKLYRMLGQTLPPELARVWNAMFKGATRATPEQAARALGLSIEEVTTRLRVARETLCLV